MKNKHNNEIDFGQLHYAEWLEKSLQDMVSIPVASICIMTKSVSGEVHTGYFDCSVADKLLFAGFLNQDAMLDTMINNGYLEDDDEEDEYGEETK